MKSAIFNYHFFRKHRQFTPSYTCKKILRPITRQTLKKEPNSVSTNSSMDNDDKVRSTINANNNEYAKKQIGKIQNDILKQQQQKHLPQHARNTIVTSSDTSTTEANLDVCGNQHSKLSAVVDKLQDHEW